MDIASIIKAGGGPLKLSQAIGCDHSSVIGWRKRGQVPVERVLALERLRCSFTGAKNCSAFLA